MNRFIAALPVFISILKHPAAQIVGVTALSALLLWPGLRGMFIFDDFGNFEGLGSIKHAGDALAFVLDSRSGPLGRPVAMASFWLQADCWPQSPWCFKIVNLVLHLLNGVLLYLIVQQIALAARRNDVRYVALAVTALWLLHPIHASTVFYAVQRMTLLAGTFTLLGLLAYFNARHSMESGRWRIAALKYWLLFPAALVLAAFSKEMGLLLIAYVLAIELVLPPTAPSRQHQVWRISTVFGPVLLVTVTLLLFWDELVLRGYGNRLFSFEERVLTQPRALVAYLLAIVSPTGQRIGLFHEDFALSTGLLEPLTTLISIIFLAATTLVAIIFRKRAPLAVLGWTWFLAGHAMESSVFPIEIYFEHRNYLPAVGILLILVDVARSLLSHLRTRVLRQLGLGLFVLYGVYIAALAHQEALLWGDPLRQASIWAEENPDSPRSQIYFNNMLLAFGHYEVAENHFEELARRFDDPLIAWMTWLEARCDYPKINEPPYVAMERAMRTVPLQIGPTNAIGRIVRDKLEGKCANVPPDVLRRLTDALIENPAFQSRLRLLISLKARIEGFDGNFEEAATLTKNLYHERKSAELALQIAAWYINAGNPSNARKWLDRAAADHEYRPSKSRTFENNLVYLEKRFALLITKQEPK